MPLLGSTAIIGRANGLMVAENLIVNIATVSSPKIAEIVFQIIITLFITEQHQASKRHRLWAQLFLA
jgi:hypothetical protein